MFIKKPKIKLTFALVLFYIIGLGAVFVSPLVPVAEAAGEEFTFFVNPDYEDDVVKAIEGGVSRPNALAQTAIYSKGGQFGKTPIQFKSTIQNIGGAKGKFIYEATYYCNGAGVTSRDSSKGDPVNVRVEAPLTKAFVKTDDKSLVQLQANFYSPDQDKVKPKCLPTGLPATVRVISFKDFNKETQKEWGTLSTSAVSNGVANSNIPANSDKKDQVDCDASGVILSWIICPIIDLGANMSDYAFQNIVSPLLEDVPVTADPKGSTYQAWSSFRVIANVFLVGTLLVIVYSQARGGGQ